MSADTLPLSGASLPQVLPTHYPALGPSHSLPCFSDRPDNLLPLDLTQLLEFTVARRCEASLGVKRWETGSLGKRARPWGPHVQHHPSPRCEDLPPNTRPVEDHRCFPLIQSSSSEGQRLSGWCLGCSEGHLEGAGPKAGAKAETPPSAQCVGRAWAATLLTH